MNHATPDRTRGPWIVTATGRLWYPYSPRPEDVCIDDMVAMANVNRYTGHAGRYSIAQHSLLVADHLRRDGHDAETQLLGLIHDAHEVYPPGDVAAPVKRMVEGNAAQNTIAAALRQLEDDACYATRTALLPRPIGSDGGELRRKKWEAVHHYDLRALATEASEFMGYDQTSAEQVAIWGRLPVAFQPVSEFRPRRGTVVAEGIFAQTWRHWFDALRKEVEL